MLYTPGIHSYLDKVHAEMGRLAGLKDLSLAQRRLRADQYAELVREPYPEPLSVRDTFITAAGREIFVRIYQPQPAETPQACLIYFHGGSFVAGSPQGHDFITASLACHTGAQVISVHYRRAPENPYPAALEDGYEALKWVSQESQALGIDPNKIAVAGDSAGGNIAAACALLARDQAGPEIQQQILVYPCLDADLGTESYLNNKNDAFLTKEAMRFALDSYLENQIDRDDGYALPMRAKHHQGLPPALILVAEHDPLRDDGIRYHQKLLQSGVHSVLQRGPGLIHGYLRARRFCPVVEDQFQQMCTEIRHTLRIEQAPIPW